MHLHLRPFRKASVSLWVFQARHRKNYNLSIKDFSYFVNQFKPFYYIPNLIEMCFFLFTIIYYLLYLKQYNNFFAKTLLTARKICVKFKLRDNYGNLSTEKQYSRKSRQFY